MEIINQLFDAVCYGADLEFKYNGFYYFVNSGNAVHNNENVHMVSVSKSKCSFYEAGDQGELSDIYNSLNANAVTDTKTFFDSKIFEGKSLYEIVNDITEINY